MCNKNDVSGNPYSLVYDPLFMFKKAFADLGSLMKSYSD